MQTQPDGKIRVATSAGKRFLAGAVVIAGGVGSFQPRRLTVPGRRGVRGQSRALPVKAAADYHGKDLVICGGGDSALDWTVALADKARSLTLVHRRAEFRAAPGHRRAHARAGRGRPHAIRRRQCRRPQERRRGASCGADDPSLGRAAPRECPRNTCWHSSVCTRSSDRSPNGVSSSRRRRSRSTPRSFRPAFRASSRSATSIPTPARKS